MIDPKNLDYRTRVSGSPSIAAHASAMPRREDQRAIAETLRELILVGLKDRDGGLDVHADYHASEIPDNPLPFVSPKRG
jgi:hypothetical protein